MEYFISELEKTLDIDLPLLSLAGAFILIDSISARNTEDGIASGPKFKNWLQNYLPNYVKMGVSMDDWYKFRCVLLHQLSGSDDSTAIPTLLFFLKSGPIQGHMNRINDAFNFDIPTFVKDTIQAARNCINQSVYYKSHANKIITLHKKGLTPYANGIPVIASALPTKGKL